MKHDKDNKISNSIVIILQAIRFFFQGGSQECDRNKRASELQAIEITIKESDAALMLLKIQPQSYYNQL